MTDSLNVLRATLVLGLAGLCVTPASAQSITDRMRGWFGGSSQQEPAPGGPAQGPTSDVECPGVDVRQGASTLSITAPGTDGGPMQTRYQVGIAQTARECAGLGGVMTMKVGILGRVLLGPAGVPGTIDIPLRMAVVQEGPNPKTIVSKFYRIAVAIPSGQTSVPFQHVEQDLTFPMPGAAALEAYVVYVGFDPQSLNQKPERKAPAKKKQTQ